ncbi:hypothetical protein WA026_007581 [Henosepilachna vigintioctopunctata]|uniref:Sulfatase N-terminal domain-containing protein n=1 Tax=Henosepilachna vigintioctopunctata TaxID=420089 RepID=A0AAW1UV97_9CUCU
MKSWKVPYFAFFWGSSLSHDEVNNPRIGDVVYLQSLESMSNRGYFDNTIVVLMSDHGIRFGPFRQTYQGGIEDRLPFLFIKVPKQFEKTYPLATANLKWNAEVLTTHFDLHETLLDISSPSRLTDQFIESGKGNQKAELA